MDNPLIPKVVYTANAKTNKVDAWIIEGEIKGIYQGEKQTICLLRRGSESCVLPKRCAFETEKAARVALES